MAQRRANDKTMTWGSKSTSRHQIQTLHEIRGRVTKREYSGPLCGGSLALLVNDVTTDPKRNHHAYE